MNILDYDAGLTDKQENKTTKKRWRMAVGKSRLRKVHVNIQLSELMSSGKLLFVKTFIK